MFLITIRDIITLLNIQGVIMLELVSSNGFTRMPIENSSTRTANSGIGQTVNECWHQCKNWMAEGKQSCQSAFNRIKSSVKSINVGQKIAGIRDYICNMPDSAIATLNKIDEVLDRKLPNWSLQNKLDAIGQGIEKLFEPLTGFNDWLNKNGEGNWCSKLATFLYKLPLRAVRNVVQMLYKLIRGILYTAVHPLKSLNHIAKMLLQLVREMTKTENWSKIGVGIMGAGLGQGLVSGNGIAVLGIAIGAALTLSGLSIEALKAAIHAEEGRKLRAVGDRLVSQFQELPESGLTAFLMGLISGGLQRAFQERTKSSFPVNNEEETMRWANQYINHHKLPKPAWIHPYKSSAGNYKVAFTWYDPNEIDQVLAIRPHWQKCFQKSWWGLQTSLNPLDAHHFDIFENAAVSKFGPLATGTATALQTRTLH